MFLLLMFIVECDYWLHEWFALFLLLVCIVAVCVYLWVWCLLVVVVDFSYCSLSSVFMMVLIVECIILFFSVAFIIDLLWLVLIIDVMFYCWFVWLALLFIVRYWLLLLMLVIGVIMVWFINDMCCWFY